MDHSKLDIEDLLSDLTFCEYCLGTNDQSVDYWVQWVTIHPEKKIMVNQARKLYFILNGNITATRFNSDYEILKKAFQEHISIPQNSTILDEKPLPVPVKRSVPLYNWLSGAAAIVVISVSIFFLNKHQISAVNSSGTAVYVSRIGQKKTLQLPDGTVVMLNSGSMLTILPGYNVHERKVNLTGEAYFNVKHNATSPFSVNTAKVDINDLGTIFNIKAYQNDKTTEATLIKGSIEVVVNNRLKNKVLLSPNKKLVILNNPQEDLLAAKSKAEKSTLPFVIGNVTNHVFKNSIIETDWVANKLSFYDQPFEDIAPLIERWYNVKLIIHNEQLKSQRLTATFDRQDISQVMSTLKQIASFSYRKEGNVIIIY